VLVAVDDLHWLDAASAAALEFTLRRSGGSRVSWLLARRSGEPARLVPEQALSPEVLTRVEVGPLTLGALHHVLDERLGRSLPRPTLRRVHEASRGNPFFALEIGRRMHEVGASPVGEPLPIPEDVDGLVLRRVRALPPETREILVAAAAMALPREALLGRIVDGPPADRLEPAEHAGIATLERGAVVFSHPLYAAAIYASATAAKRRDVHRRLATVVEGPEERARHLALATVDSDGVVAAVVHDAARSAFLRGAPIAAVELVELATRIDPSGATAPEWRFDLAYYLYCASEPARAREVLSEVADWTDWPPALEARARGLVMEIVLVEEGALRAVELGERMLRESLPTEARGRVLAHLSNAYEFDSERAWARGEEALAILDELGAQADPGTYARVLCWRVRNRLGLGRGLDRGDMERALELEARLPRERWLGERVSYRFGIWLRHVDELDESRAKLEGDLADAVDAADDLLQLTLLVHLALTECTAGNLELARTRMTAASEIASELDARPAGLVAARAYVEAHLGNEDLVRVLVDEVHERADGEESGPAAIQANVALGLLELSLGRETGADESLRAALRGIEAAGQREPGVFRAHGLAGEAAVALGDTGRAEQIADLLTTHGMRTGHRWSLAAGSRVSALLLAVRGDLDGALAEAGRALSLYDELAMPFERARSLVVKGALERRARQRRRADASLEAAIAELERMGATVWAARARGEHARVGLRRSRSAGDGLTPSEARVAELAAKGLTTREIANELFVSPKTVEANLTRIYRKLGVRSRAALATRLALTTSKAEASKT